MITKFEAHVKDLDTILENKPYFLKLVANISHY